MRVLHVLNSAGGGASIGALELMRTSREVNSGIEHFAVYPGLEEQPDAAVRAVCADCRAVPMRWWNRKTSLSPLRRAVVWAREMQLTAFGHRTRRQLRQLVRAWRIDLIHTNTAATIDGAIVARQLGLPHVWHIRERIGRHGFMRFRLNDSTLVRRIGALSAAIIPMSHYVGELFLANGAAVKTHVIHDGVDVSLFDSQEARARGRLLRRSWGVPESAILVANVATVTATVKRHDLFIRAAGLLAKRCPEMWFAVIGALPKLTSWTRRQGVLYLEQLRRMVREEGLEDRFVWTDHVGDCAAIMNAIEILAHACDLEGFGRVAIEAMAAGKPVVGPAAGGFAESVVDGRTGYLVAPRDHQALAEGVERLARSPGLRHEYGHAGHQRVVARFSPRKHLDAVLSVYQSLSNEECA